MIWNQESTKILTRDTGMSQRGGGAGGTYAPPDFGPFLTAPP